VTPAPDDLSRGIREAWIVDPDEKTIDVLGVAAGSSVLCRAGDTARSVAVPGFSVLVERLFET
jgi:hypothetical protein